VLIAYLSSFGIHPTMILLYAAVHLAAGWLLWHRCVDAWESESGMGCCFVAHERLGSPDNLTGLYFCLTKALFITFWKIGLLFYGACRLVGYLRFGRAAV